MSPASVNPTNNGHAAGPKTPHISQLSRPFRRASKTPEHKKSTLGLGTITEDRQTIQPAIPAPLKTSKPAKSQISVDQLNKFLQNENEQLKKELAYHVHLIGAGTTLEQTMNRCVEDLQNALLVFNQTQKQLNEEYYSSKEECRVKISDR
jgi:hypothetical protein